MSLLKLAFRNLRRHRKRTVITAFIIAFAVLFYVFADSLVSGMMEASYENITDFEFGHLQITSSDYWEEREDYPLENLVLYEVDTAEEIKSLSEVENFSPRLDFQAELSDGRDKLPIIGRGFDFEMENDAFNIEGALVEGSFFAAGENYAVLGAGLAEDMQLSVGDFITLQVRTPEEYFNVIDLEISGLVHTPNPQINDNLVYLPLERAQQVLTVEDKISHLAFSLTDRHLSREITETINQLPLTNGTNFKAFSWEDGAEELIYMQEYSDNMLILILGVILLLAAAGVINTVVLSVLERLQEIAMMKALGLKIKEITLVFSLEAGGIGFLGGIIGCFLALAAVAFLNTQGIELYAGMEGELDMPISMARIYGRWNPGAFMFVFFYSIIVSFISGLLPAYWGARQEPVDILKE